MGTPEQMMSAAAQHALRDMVELEMYLVAQSQETPWPMLPRGTKLHGGREPYINPVESSAAKELIGQGFIEPTSRQIFVVSKSGYQFYNRELKSHSA